MRKTLISIALALALTLSVGGLHAAGDAPGVGLISAPLPLQGSLFLHIGSPVALSGGVLVKLDSANPDVTPVLYKGYTLIPALAVAEHFAATVTWDDLARTTTITTAAGTVAQFPIGQPYFLLDGERVDLEVGGIILNGRTMVPLRVIGERVLGMNVDYLNGLISMTGGPSPLSDPAVVDLINGKIATALKIGSAAALEAMIARAHSGDEYVNQPNFSDAVASPTAPALSEAAADAAGANDRETGYSQTNTQVEGIDEGDVIKTDGRHIYVLSGTAVKIYAVSAGQIAHASTIQLEDGCYASEMYVHEGRLVLIGSRYEPGEGDEVGVQDENRLMQDSAALVIGYRPGRTFTFVRVYDTSDMANPAPFKSYEIEGYLTSSRKQDGIVYLVSGYSTFSGIVPLLRDTAAGGAETPLPISDIMYIIDQPAEQYLTVSAVDILDKAAQTEVESILGSGYTTYMNANALYVSSSLWSNQTERTQIIKFSVDGALIAYAGSGTVDGSLYGQFALDEYEGYLRVATTEREAGNHVFVLDASLNTVGSVRGLAKGESIYAVRFMGERGYVVTYLRVDPLYVLDLSDPLNPRVSGELKVPGFSNYLHPISETLIVGIGYDSYDIYKKDAQGRDVVVGTQTGGIKISLFDVSDMGKPVEVQSLVLGENGSYTEATYNHKAVLYRASDGLLAFDARLVQNPNVNDASRWDDLFDGAVLLHVGADGIRELNRIDAPQSDALSGKEAEVFYAWYGTRLLYVDNVLYYIRNNQISSYSLTDYRPIASVNLSH